MKVVALVGDSGSGKTTLICRAIEQLVADGVSVGAIKHTHHELNRERRGDTARFLDAGAAEVILAGNGIAIDPNGGEVAFDTPDELLRHLHTEVVLVEGFKQFAGWPRIEVHRDARPALADVLLLLASR
jgi:molybdopterin-guanine dinucleotide biosynthesis protein B